MNALDFYSSPWGQIDHKEELAHGIIQVYTSSHGGIWLDNDRQEELQRNHAWVMQCVGNEYAPKPTWWEEDCEATLILIAFYDQLRSEVQQRINRQELLDWVKGFYKVENVA